MAGQILAALVLIVGGVSAHLFSDSLWFLNVAVTIVWIVGICNAINYMDNMDGLAAGVSAVAAGSFLILAALNQQVLVASLAAALRARARAFWFTTFNLPSPLWATLAHLLLGFMLAVLGIKLSLPHISPQSTWMAPIIVLGLPLFIPP